MDVSEASISSIDEATRFCGRAWSPHLITVRDRSRLDLKFRCQTLTSDTSFTSLSYGATTRIEPEKRDPVILVKLPQQGELVALHGRESTALKAGQIGVIDVASVKHVDCSADFMSLVLRIRTSRLKRYLSAALGSEPRTALRFTGVLLRDMPQWSVWVPLMAFLLELDRSPESARNARTVSSLEEMLLAAVLTTVPNTYSTMLLAPQPSIAPRHVKRAEQFIAQHLQEALTTATIAEHVGVSIRALFDGFQSFRQTTPARYLRQLRIEAAHETLLHGEESVADIAEQWGYRHAGNFAHHYKERFGQSPADTRRYGRLLSC